MQMENTLGRHTIFIFIFSLNVIVQYLQVVRIWLYFHPADLDWQNLICWWYLLAKLYLKENICLISTCKCFSFAFKLTNIFTNNIQVFFLKKLNFNHLHIEFLYFFLSINQYMFTCLIMALVFKISNQNILHGKHFLAFWKILEIFNCAFWVTEHR